VDLVKPGLKKDKNTKNKYEKNFFNHKGSQRVSQRNTKDNYKG
jgi:hypothetical protein